MKAQKLNREQQEYQTDDTSSTEQDEANTISVGSQNPMNASSPKKSSPKKKRMQADTKKKVVSKKSMNLKSKVSRTTRNSKQASPVPENSGMSTRMKRKRTTFDDIYDDIEAKFIVLERADRVYSSLPDHLPSFAKCMLPSNVAHGFWLHLPRAFCKMHLPSRDSTITLVDEWGNEYKTTYLLDRHGLSAGWRGFSLAHRLLKGDILIFSLIEPLKFKVYIVRVNGNDVVNAALCLMNMESAGKSTDFDIVRKDIGGRKGAKKHPALTRSFGKSQKCGQKIVLKASSSSNLMNCSENNGDKLSSEDLQDSEMALHSRSKAKELCCPEASIIHDQPRKSVACT